ncbi:choice-of-anchor A family protein [Streptomyces antimicrobicus]|uniref:Choice-of-anchor A family protein n=1 Tax=Streptomyces antimicrobicus TaxID=2883108 RepID=A0ABS8BFQ1_9ACTN|nr:choice-of-anchor A family protein [Streptomyces antimicrobicus]MCB5183464.1 choice-of-anchor A family protein [Streptomyces antimicrobicus]
MPRTVRPALAPAVLVLGALGALGVAPGSGVPTAGVTATVRSHPTVAPDATCPDPLGFAGRQGEFVAEGDRRTRVGDGPGSPDVAAEFRALRGTSAALASLAAAQWRLEGTVLHLPGHDGRFNAFSVPAGVLEHAREVRIEVPAGAVTTVTVEGTAYDEEAAGGPGFAVAEAAGPQAGGVAAADGRLGTRLLWNFPDAVRLVKRSPKPWPGTLLAPDAAVDLGTAGAAGAAGTSGSVIARSLSGGSGSAGTQQEPFTGCLPVPGPAGHRPGPASTSASPAATADGAGVVVGTGPNGSAGTDLAVTGSARSGTLAVAGGLVLAVGAAMVLIARRRGA